MPQKKIDLAASTTVLLLQGQTPRYQDTPAIAPESSCKSERTHLQDLALEISEGLLPFPCKDFRNGGARQLLYEVVAVQEGVLQCAGNNLPHSALTTAQNTA